jgi:cytochrome c oxidase subunit 2
MQAPQLPESPSRPPALEVWAVSAAFFLLGVGIVAYGRGDWLPTLASKHGAGIDTMLRFLLATTGTLVLVGLTVLAWLIWRGGLRARVTHRLASPRIELGLPLAIGVLMAVLAEGGVLAIGLPVWDEYFGAAPPPDALTIDVVAQQFLWNVRYPGADGTFGRTDTRLIDETTNPIGLDRTDPAAADDILLVNQIVAAVNRPIHVRLHSKDMIHSFFLPHLRVKQDAIPGMMPEVTFVPTREGTFELACAELCGLGHYKMQGLFKVVAPGELERAIAEAAQ